MGAVSLLMSGEMLEDVILRGKLGGLRSQSDISDPFLPVSLSELSIQQSPEYLRIQYEVST